jgi:2-dehydropantoate 2-reductase
LKIGILGAGAMGILYGGLLSKNGNKVKFIVKNETKKKIINDKGIKLNIDSESFIVNPGAILAKEATEFNLIIIFTKTNDTTSALNSIKQIINKNTFLMSLQNGLGNLEKLLKFSDSSKIIYGTTMAPADLNSVREVSSFGSHVSQFRLADNKNNCFTENILNIFNNAKLNSIINKNVDNVIWSKVAFNTAMNTICALLEITPSSIDSNKDLKSFAKSVATETCEVAIANDIKIDKEKVFKNIELSCREHGDHKPSMLQDILLKKQTEIDALNGEVIKIGSSLNINTPLNSSLFHLIKARENNY